MKIANVELMKIVLWIVGISFVVYQIFKLAGSSKDQVKTDLHKTFPGVATNIIDANVDWGFNAINQQDQNVNFFAYALNWWFGTSFGKPGMPNSPLQFSSAPANPDNGGGGW